MLNQQIISAQIAPLQYSQTVGDAQQLMEALELTALPIVKDGHYEGLLQEDSLLDADANDLLSLFEYDLMPVSVNADDHFIAAAKLATERSLKVVPVITAEKEYVGSITEEELLRQMSKLTGVQEGGAIVVLEMEPTNYSPGELSKLVETNDAIITQLNTATDETTGRMTVTMRINKQEVSDIISTLQRYDYQVVFFAGQELYENELQHNYQHLMNFLSM